MIIGNGLIANKFKNFKHEKYVIFASGVSNSQECKKENFLREKVLLEKIIKKYPDKLFIYFSTCSIYDKNSSQYILHKIEMENIIKQVSENFYIFRLPQVVGRGKSPTLVNFLFKNIINSIIFNLYSNAKRNLIYIDDIFLIVLEILNKRLYSNSIINIATPYNISVLNIVKCIEQITHKNAEFIIISDGSNSIINIEKIKSLESYCLISDKNYYCNILDTFYKKDFIDE